MKLTSSFLKLSIVALLSLSSVTNAQENQTIKDLEKLTTDKAAQQFIRRALDLEKSADDIFPPNIASVGMSKEVESKILEVFSKWTQLWYDISVYYSEFKPRSVSEAYGIFLSMFFAALGEAITSSNYIGYRTVSPDHLGVAVKLLELKISMFDFVKHASYSGAELSDPRYVESFSIPNVKGKYGNGIEMSVQFADLSSQSRELFDISKSSTDLEKINKEFLELLKMIRNSRLKAGNLLDQITKFQPNHIYRTGVCMDILQSITLYALFKKKYPTLPEIGLQITKTQQQDAKANVKLLERLQQYSK